MTGLSVSTYDVAAIREQPSGRYWFVVDGDETVLHSREEALRILNPRSAYRTDDYASGLLDRAAEYSVDALVSLDRRSFRVIVGGDR